MSNQRTQSTIESNINALVMIATAWARENEENDDFLVDIGFQLRANGYENETVALNIKGANGDIAGKISFSYVNMNLSLMDIETYQIPPWGEFMNAMSKQEGFKWEPQPDVVIAATVSLNNRLTELKLK